MQQLHDRVGGLCELQNAAKIQLIDDKDGRAGPVQLRTFIDSVQEHTGVSVRQVPAEQHVSVVEVSRLCNYVPFYTHSRAA